MSNLLMQNHYLKSSSKRIPMSKDNKNQQLLVFVSLLTTKEVFEELWLGFLVVDHMHENIDGSFN